MDSPLTRQARPETFEPKIVQLYQQLFKLEEGRDVEESVPPEGFWREIFSLKPEKQKFIEVLDPLSADSLLQLQYQTRLFFRRAIEEAGSGLSPRNENALENLTGFLTAILSKKYTNPSTDVIEVLAGLNAVDKLMSDFVQGLEAIIKSSPNRSFRHKAVDTALAIVSGSYQTSLVTYFIHRDFFSALMKYSQEVDEPTTEGFVLLGLLANYNKFESQNLYQNRLEDFVNENIITVLVSNFVQVGRSIRDRYIDVSDDAPTPWTLNSTLSIVGLGALSKDQKKPLPTEEEARALFNALPAPEASIILTGYSFVQANKIFASHLLSTTSDKDQESPLSSFLSATSYLCHHAHRSARTAHYAILSLLTIRVLLDDPIQTSLLTSSDHKTSIRLARQRAPHLPLITTARIPATAIMDICTDTLSHNLRKRISIPLYNLVLTILHRLITHLDTTKTRLQHHWPYIWGSLLSLLRFLTQYAQDLSPTYQVRAELCTPLTSLLAFCLSRGDNFLPDPASYDDLFYKVVEINVTLPKFKEAYCPASSSSSTAGGVSGVIKLDPLTVSTNALLRVTSHFQSLLGSSAGKKLNHQSPATVQKIIKEGYETLPDLQTAAVVADIGGAGAGRAAGGGGIPGANVGGVDGMIDFGYREKWRESGWKVEIKKIVRTVVEDARVVALKKGMV